MSNLLRLCQGNTVHVQEGQRTLVTEYCQQICKTFVAETGTEQQSNKERLRRKLEQSFCHFSNELKLANELGLQTLINFTFQ